MDPVCEEKINFLQKYIPFLANLIKLLANDSEKEGKLAQMQLLYNLLNKPDNSVKIETLEKCEEVLSRVFGNGDEKCDGSDFTESTIQCIPFEDNIKVECEDVVENSQLEEVDEGATTEQTNGHTNAEDNNTPVPDSLENKSITIDDVPQNSSKEQVTEIASKEVAIEGEENKELSTDKQEVALEIGESNEDVQDSPTTNPNLETNVVPSEIEKDISADDANKSSNSAIIDEKAVDANISEEKEESLELPEGDERLVETETETEYQDTITEEVPQSNANIDTNESEPFILPDDGEINADLTEQAMRITPDNLLCEMDTVEEAEEQNNVFVQNPTEILPFKIISAESLATSSDRNLLEQIDPDNDPEDVVETAKEQNRTDDDPLDPLNPTSDLVESEIPENDKLIGLVQQDGSTNNDDEDDDVLLIETRSSPICIDSDPEDEESTQKGALMTPVHAKIIPEPPKPAQKSKPSARKSTAIVKDPVRPASSNNQTTSIRKTASQRKSKENSLGGYIVKKDPKILMETINLIDSDSDEEHDKSKNTEAQNDDDVIIVGSSSQQRKVVPAKKTGLVVPLHQSKRLIQKLHNKNAGKPPTAQSNFLNAVNLQPAPETLPKGTSLSSQVSSKNDPIPNIILKNSPYKRKLIPTVSTQPRPKTEQPSNDSISKSLSASVPQDRVLKEWLVCFLKNFASPQQVASHACFVLLQRVLKYRFFQRLKVTRLVLNMRAKNCEPGKMDLQILLDLRNIFIKNDVLTESGHRFCRFATNDAFGKPVALTTDARTGKVTCRTRLVSGAATPSEVAKIPERPTSSTTHTSQVTSNPRLSTSTVTASPATPVPSSSTTLGSNSTCSKRTKKLRKLSDGVVTESNDNDYTPYMGELVLEDEVVSERKKSLRTNRTKRKEAGFTYSEDHDDEEFEALAKKIEDKKREELRLAEEKELEKEREKERKVKKTVAKKTTSKRQTNVIVVDTDLPKEPIRKKLRLADAEILGTGDDDLLTPTWIEADGDDDDGEVDSLLDFAEAPQTPENHIAETESCLPEDDVDTSQSFEDFEPYPASLDVGTNKQLKNTSRNHHTQCKKFDFCVHCLKRVPRIVHHYVNEHRSGEVFTSRLRTRNIRRLLTTSNVGFVHLYKGNQQQYAAHCIFCDKEVKFLLPYWYEHFTMHTGEYSFKCSGCSIRKPTRSLLANHLQSGSGCPKKGSAIRLHTFDTKSNQIEGYICTICNYIQLHRKNVLIHLLTQHEIETVFPDHIVKVVLLQVSGPYRDEESIKDDESKMSLLQSSDDEETVINGAVDDNSLLMQNDFTDNDDLSFMICGMLDVQTNLSDAGNILGNDDDTNSVDNK